MFNILRARLDQSHRTVRFPEEPPALPPRFRGRPEIDAAKCPDGCRACADACPTNAVIAGGPGAKIDLGRCLFCTDCLEACPEGAIRYTEEYRLAARTREASARSPGMQITADHPCDNAGTSPARRKELFPAPEGPMMPLRRGSRRRARWRRG